jgi:NAD-dependent SIR2 family protein deacetylase
VQVVTTNVDTLFERAGIQEVYHVHGTTILLSTQTKTLFSVKIKILT